MTDEVKVEQIDAVKQAEEWLRAIHDWLLTFDYDMDLPTGILDVDPLDIADRLATRPAPAEDAVERVAKAIYEEDDPWCKAWHWPDLNTEAQGGQGTADRYRDIARAALAAMQPRGKQQEWPADAAFAFGSFAKKKGKADWRGRICGWYRTDMTPLGYVIESAYHFGSVQLYPATGIEPWDGEQQAGREEGR